MTEQNSIDHQQLKSFNIIDASAFIRARAKSANSMEELAGATTRYLFDNLTTESGLEKACALVRFFRTIEFQYLEPRLRDMVIRSAGERQPTDKCLTLLGTTGIQEQWNSREASADHQVIPLLSPAMVAASPMIARLITQLGIEISSLFVSQRSEKLRFNDPKDRDYNIFYVPDARNSPFIPSQEHFVNPHGIRSVIGYGSLLPSGDLYAVIMFFRVLLPQKIPKQFTALALSTTIAALSLKSDALFDSAAG